MSDDSDYDDVAHSKLLKSVRTGKIEAAAVRKSVGKINSDDLFNSIKTAKQSTAKAKKAPASGKDTRPSVTDKTLVAPVHRQERERIHGAVGYIELKKDLSVWKDVVETNKFAEQMTFPLHQEKVLTVDTAAEKSDGFKPKTDLELEMANLLNSSKHNMKNDTVYTEAELEIIRAMNVKEAKAKLDSMQKMRALVSYRESKYRYAAKIKSKGYHRLLKREKRRQLVKEFDDLLVRDPEAAKEKLEELENQRVLERGSLRHHARSKFQKEIVKHAGKDPMAKKVLEEHLRLGRELKSKIGEEAPSDVEEVEPEKRMSVADIIKSAALAASADSAVEKVDIASAKQQLFELRAKKRSELAKARVKADGTVGAKEDKTPIFEENTDWAEPEPEKLPTQETTNVAENTTPVVKKSKKIKAKQSKNKKDIDAIFNEAESKLVSDLRQEASEIRAEETPDVVDEPKTKKRRKSKVKEESVAPAEPAVDISLDPRHFLQVETNNLSKVSADLVDKMDEFEQDQERMVAEAFRDDDVIGEFEAEKEMIEEGERPKDVDLTLQGWGCWVGPGMTERKRRKQFVVKANAKKRKDKGKSGVIIAETKEPSIAKLQPRTLPFPYTRVEDFQAVVSQPIGKEWNPVSVTRDLCKPAIITQAGRSIRPIDKAEAIKKTMHDSDNEDE